VVDLPELLAEREWRRCAPDWDASTPEQLLEAFEYWSANYVSIRFPGKGRIAFELREAQRVTALLWLQERYTITLKARQVGFSTLVSIFAFWCCFFYPDRVVIMLSKTERDAQKLLTHARYAYRFLPDWMKMRGPLVNVNQTRIDMSNESVLESLPSASDPARGVTAFIIVVDEVGQLPNSEEAYAAIEPVADVGGRIIMLGTANGEGNLFHRLWVAAENGVGRFVSNFHSWRAGDRDQAWYDAKKADLPDWQLAQEYPDNPEEAFLRSGRPVFDIEKVRQQRVEDPVCGGFAWWADGGFREGDGDVRLWKQPVEGHKYVLGVDVAEGVDWGDFSAAHMIDANTGEVVACYHAHIDPDLFATQVLIPLATFYNRALLIVEVNNHGLTTLTALRKERYFPLYKQRRVQTGKPTEQYGWRTTSASKPLAIDELGQMIRDLDITIWDEGTLAELRTFVRDGNGRMHGSPHDDRVMSLAIAVQGLKHVHLAEYKEERKPPPGTMGWFLSQFPSDTPRSGARLGVHGVRQVTLNL